MDNKLSKRNRAMLGWLSWAAQDPNWYHKGYRDELLAWGVVS